MKKLFGEIELTWKKVIIFAIITAIYTALMAIIPITKDTSFRDIAIHFECWILFGVIIIINSQSKIDSALKCFVFFLISQPLIYILQIPFSNLGFGILAYYKNWILWTILTIPMGFIGYYIKNKSIVSMIILIPMLLFLAFIGLGYFTALLDNFPHHLLSFIFCFLLIIVFIFTLFDKWLYRIIQLIVVVLFIIIFIILKGGSLSTEFETVHSLDRYNLNLSGKVLVKNYSGTAKGYAKIINNDDSYILKINGRYNGMYKLTIVDENNNSYNFKYYYDKNKQTVIVKQIK